MEDSGVAGRGTARLERSAPTVPWGARAAGGLLVAVGLLNVVLGAISLSSTMIRLAPGAAGGLVVAGALTALGGWFVWNGNRIATLSALGIFAWLLIIQIADVATHEGPEVAAGGLVGRFAVLALVIAALVVATIQLRRRRPN